MRSLAERGNKPMMTNKDIRERMEKMGWMGCTMHVVLGGRKSGREKADRYPPLQTGELKMVANGYYNRTVEREEMGANCAV